ncbi:MAG TPA: LL-diaminopimelate aminotransferase [Candidatus Rifleibacterium sp.]|nr:LL-diaminopimelate aminotransferase [Candidatus Rifleibacterium sp.]HPT44666.1 LL-diaminopimelate aminotransferase [Candidatus Rifleibacterium sp.]
MTNQPNRNPNQKLRPASRVLNLPPYIFSEIDDRKNELKRRGIDLLNFGIGDPDLPTPDFVVEELCEQAHQNHNQKYPSYNGSAAFRQAVCEYMQTRFAVKLNPETQASSVIGTKEGLAHFSWAYLEEGDLALIPDPSFPVYANSARFAGAGVYLMPLLEQNNFVPDVTVIPEEVAARSKVMFINYPNNPTGAVATRGQVQKIIDWAVARDVIVVADAAYAELVYDPADRFSALCLPGAEKVVIEYHSFSKTFNMTGWRLGFAVGNPSLVAGLVKLKTNIDSGVFDAIQLAGIKALQQLPACSDQLMQIYRQRRDALVQVLGKAGFDCFMPAGAFYLMVRCPPGVSSMQFTIDLMEKCGVITTPGSGFGACGEGYIRFALTRPVEVINRLAERLPALQYR